MRVLVIGADACGASAASTIKRMKPDYEVLVLERQAWTSYSACGIPYWLAGETEGPEPLIARTPEQHRANGLDLRTGWEATAIDVGAQRVTAKQLAVGTAETFVYDHLVIGTGSVPRRPAIPGIDLPGVHGVQTIDDGLAVVDSLGRPVRNAVVVGAGYIGIEMAEAMCRRGFNVTVVDLAGQPMTTLDPDMGELIATAMAGMGIAYRGGEPVSRFVAGQDGYVSGVVTSSGEYPADIVILGMGVQPNSGLAHRAGLPLRDHGGIATDEHMRVVGQSNVWAGGDCVEVLDRITGRYLCVPLGTHANKHGRVIGTNIGGGDLTFPGVVGTAVSKVCDLEISRVGLTQAEAAEHGFDTVSARIQASTKAHYMPGSGPIHVKAIAERGSGRMLGCQIVGQAGSGKRIDAAAVAIWNQMTAEQVTSLDLAYAPPFSPVWDPIQIAARRLTSLL